MSMRKKINYVVTVRKYDTYEAEINVTTYNEHEAEQAALALAVFQSEWTKVKDGMEVDLVAEVEDY